MDEELLTQQTQYYLQAVGTAWSTLEGEVPLEDVYCLLEALTPRERKPLEPREELAPDADRLLHADVPPDRFQPRPPEPLGEVLKRHTHLVLLGEPGAGKTTTLQFLGLAFAQEGWAWAKLGLDERRVPVFLSLRAYVETLAQTGDALMRALSEEVGCRLMRRGDEARPLVDAWGSRGELFLLLDGLDEVPDEKRERVREQVLAYARTPQGRAARIVVTSRLAGFRSLGDSLAEFTVRPLAPGQAKEFLTKWLQALDRCSGEEAQQKADDLWPRLEGQPALARLLDNPLILRLVASHYCQKGEIARTRADLYRAYVEEAWARAQRRGAPKEEKGAVLEALQALAWHLHGGGSGEEGVAREAIQRYAKVAEPERAAACLALARERAGLVASVGGRMTFSHTTFQEYFVALRLRAAWQKDRKATWRFLRPRLHLPAWREPLLLLAGLLKPEEARRLVWQVRRARSPYEGHLRRDLSLAAALTGASGLDAPDLARALLRDLRAALRDEDPGVRWAAAEALGELGPQAAEALPDLVRAALRDEDPEVRWAAAWALGELGPQAAEALPDLRAALRDKRERVRWAAALALARLGPQAAEALPDLALAALGDEDPGVRRAAAEALGRLGPQAVEALPDLVRAALRDEDPGVRGAASVALGRLGPQAAEALPDLRAALGDEDPWVRRAAAEALGRLGPQAAEALPDLRAALRDKRKWVRWAAAVVLGELGPQAAEALPDLRAALRDGSKEVRRAAAGALGRLGPQAAEALPDLARAALGDEDPWVRWAAAEALEELGPHLPAQDLEDLARRLARGRSYDALRNLLPHLEAHRAAEVAFDPLHPPPPPGWQRALVRAGWGLLALLGLGVVGGVLAVVLAGAGEVLLEALKPWLREQSPWFLLLVVVVVAGVVELIRWALRDRWKGP